MIDQHINGRRLTFEDEGAGEPLVLLHAFPLHAGMWRHQLAALARRHRVIAPNLPGFGGSEPVSPNGSPMDRVGDAVAVLLEALRVPRAIFAGCSMGGYAALALARRYPKIVRGLVLSNTRMTADTDAQRAGRAQTAQALMARGTIELEENNLPKLLGPGATEALHAEVRDMVRAASPVGAAAAARGMGSRLDSSDWLGRFDAPVLVVHADDDAVIARAESEAMAARARRGTLATVANAGHLAPLEQPEAWNAAVTGWIATVPK